MNIKKKQEMQNAKQICKHIVKALVAYQADHRCIPRTSGTVCPGAIGEYVGFDSGGWDLSSIGDFLPFLVSKGYLAKVPVDPINNMTTYGETGKYAYKYFCYDTGLNLGYWKEVGGWSMVLANINSGLGNSADNSFICK